VFKVTPVLDKIVLLLFFWLLRKILLRQMETKILFVLMAWQMLRWKED